MSAIPPIEMSVHVKCSVEEAFRLFTAEMSSWWPLRTHSVGGEKAKTVSFEAGVGGLIEEITADGARHLWGTVLRWEPPRNVAFSWHPGRAEDTGQEVELRFRSAGDVTEVTLTHTGWERLGEEAEEARAGYEGGWKEVFGRRYRGAADERQVLHLEERL